MKKYCCIFAAGDLSNPVRLPDDCYVIAADAGYLHARANNLVPDLLVGDFDSLEEIPKLKNVMKYPSEKDYTDTELAIKIGIDKGFSDFIVFGAIGGKRLEHTIANLQLAVGIAKSGKNIVLTDGTTVITALHNGTMRFSDKEEGYVSVFSFDGNAAGVSVKNLKYELDNAALPCTGTLGVSNEFISKPSEISVKNGTLIIIYGKKDGFHL